MEKNCITMSEEKYYSRCWKFLSEKWLQNNYFINMCLVYIGQAMLTLGAPNGNCLFVLRSSFFPLKSFLFNFFTVSEVAWSKGGLLFSCQIKFESVTTETAISTPYLKAFQSILSPLTHSAINLSHKLKMINKINAELNSSHLTKTVFSFSFQFLGSALSITSAL